MWTNKNVSNTNKLCTRIFFVIVFIIIRLFCLQRYAVCCNYRSVHCCANAEKYLMIELDSEFCNVNENDGI